MLKYVTVTERKRKKSAEDSNDDEDDRRSSKKENKRREDTHLKLKENVDADADIVSSSIEEVGGSAIAESASELPTEIVSGKSKDILRYEMVKGDLFSCSEQCSLAHCVSADMRLGKGIAALFKKKFGGIDDLKKQGASPGGLAVLKRGRRFIYNLVTKEKFWQKPTYKTLESSLLCMKKHCQDNDVGNLAMPMIGCGLDGLVWSEVEKLVRRTFTDLDMSITVYRL